MNWWQLATLLFFCACFVAAVARYWYMLGRRHAANEMASSLLWWKRMCATYANRITELQQEREQ